MGLLDGLKRYGEPGLGLLSGAVAEPIAGWAGLLSGGNAQNVANVRNMLTYQPRSAAGVAGQNDLANALLGVKTAMVDENPPVRMAVDGYNALADKMGMYSPALGAAARTAPAAAMAFMGPGSSVTRKAFANVATDTGRAMAPKVGQMAENYMRRTGGLLDMDVYHGSPHKFDKFDGSKIGTGEGAQVYGHGIYVAESPAVAKQYADTLGFRGAIDKGGNQYGKYELASFFSNKLQEKGVPKANAEAQANMWADKFSSGGKLSHSSALEVINAKGLKPVDTGSLYKVDLPDDQIAKMLDWDKPLSQQHPDVQSIVQSLMKDGQQNQFGWLTNQGAPEGMGMTGKQFLNTLQGGEAQMQKAGITGIRYLDGGSRGTGAGSSNFVVFPGNEGMLKILERNGMPIK